MLQNLVFAGLKIDLISMLKNNQILIKFWIDWKPFNGPKGPQTDGLSAGQDDQGRECYIGRGTYQRQLAPGKLLIEGDVGLYIEHSHNEHRITSNVEYYAKEPTCNYKWVPSSKGEAVVNAVQYNGTTHIFYVGRTFASNSMEVGKIHLGEPRLHYGKGHQIELYEVLVCDPPVNDKKCDEICELKVQVCELKAELKIQNLKQIETRLNECEAKLSAFSQF